MNNPLSYSSLKLDLYSKDGIRLKPASGFMVEVGSKYYLITNWHVLSGRNISAHESQEQIVEPYILKTSLHIYGGEGKTSQPLFMGNRKRITVQLYDDNGAPRWLEGRAKAQHQQMVDVVALPVELNQFLSLSSGRITDMHLSTYVSYQTDSPSNYWAKVSTTPISAIDTDVEYGPPDTVYVIGYPLSWAPDGRDKSSAAFWRTASIASEIHEKGRTYPNVFFIDPSAPEGMTGSPVVGMKNGRTKLLGVYSDSSTAEFGANAGLVWDALLVKELIGAS